MSVIADCVAMPNEQPSIEPYFIECKFTVESKHGDGGDWEKNIGGTMGNKRITFEGYPRQLKRCSRSTVAHSLARVKHSHSSRVKKP